MPAGPVFRYGTGGFVKDMGDGMETFKVNGVFGTDFDCMNEQFATKGLSVFVISLPIRRMNIRFSRMTLTICIGLKRCSSRRTQSRTVS